MTAQVERVILKGAIGTAIQIRHMFQAEVDIVSPDTRQVVWEQYLGLILTHVKPWLTNVLSYSSIEYQYRLGDHWEPLEELAYTNAGTGAGENYNSMVAAVLIGRASGRRHMGRKFFSGLIESGVAADIMTASAVTAFGLAAVDYISPMTTAAGSVLVPGIWGKDGIWRAFVSGWVATLLGTIRSRKLNRGI